MASADDYVWGTGRRKTSVARVRIMPGRGEIKINERDMDDFFTLDRDRQAIRAPMKAAKLSGRYNVVASVRGGGFTGQAGAVMLGIARALLKTDHTLLGVLREGGFLTRDARMVERKKYGRRGARRGFQFSKR